MPKTLYQELVEAISIEPAAGETFAVFAKRAALKINKLPDPKWKELSEELQKWNNETLTAVDTKAEIPVLEGYPEEAADEQAAEDNAEVEAPPAGADEAEETGEEAEGEAEGEEGEEATPRAGKRAGKPAKPAVKAKPAAKKAAPAKAAKAKAPAKAKGNGAKGRPGLFPLDAKIKVLAKENPHRTGTKNFKSFAKYKSGMTLAEALKAGVPRANVRFETGLGHIKVG